MSNDEREVLVELQNLDEFFKIGKNKILKAVEDVSFKIYRGETFGLVGESGCGKTTCGRTIINLYKATGGKVIFEGEDISKIDKKDIKSFKKKAQMIFQDPYSSLDPKMTIGEIIAEGIRVHFSELSEGEIQERVSELLKTVGLNAEHGARFPHELSGGQRQRIGIARALAMTPKIIFADEPTGNLDTKTTAEVLELMQNIVRDTGQTLIMVTHDAKIASFADRQIRIVDGKMQADDDDEAFSL